MSQSASSLFHTPSIPAEEHDLTILSTSNASPANDKPSDTISLKRIGRYNEVYMWSSEDNDQFIEWWRKTKWFHEHDRKNGYTEPKIIWGSPKRANCWPNIYEGAACLDGQPIVVCKRCSKALKHPAVGTGNSTIERHFTGKDCKKISRTRGLPQITIEESFRAKV